MNNVRLEDISIAAWLHEHKIVNEKGYPIDLKGHYYLYEPYTDLSPLQVYFKAAQVGLSTEQILKAFWVCDKLELDVIYTLPTDNDVSMFVEGKVNRMIQANDILMQYTKDKDSIFQKRVGNGMLNFKGSFSKRKAISTTADLLIHDEPDFSDQIVIGDYESRLQHSKFKWKWCLGHPSTIGVGVSKYWDVSTQKHWFIKCPKCRKLQYLSWPESVDEHRRCYQCKKCKAELSDETRRKGEWVKKYNDREWQGYWIPLLIAPWIGAGYIIDKHNDSDVSEEFFTNRILGLPYVGGGNRVNREDIIQNITNKVNSQKGKVVIGVDTGIYLRFVVGNGEGIFYFGQTKKYSDIEKLMKIYDKSVVVIDQGGDIIGARELQEKYHNRVYLCHYRQDRKTLNLIKWGTGEEEGNVIVDRNRMIQLVIDEFKTKRITLNGEVKDFENYWTHWSNIYRVIEEDELHIKKYKWLRAGRDDWVHATIYWRVGMSRFSGELTGYIL